MHAAKQHADRRLHGRQVVHPHLRRVGGGARFVRALHGELDLELRIVVVGGQRAAPAVRAAALLGRPHAVHERLRREQAGQRVEGAEVHDRPLVHSREAHVPSRLTGVERKAPALEVHPRRRAALPVRGALSATGHEHMPRGERRGAQEHVHHEWRHRPRGRRRDGAPRAQRLAQTVDLLKLKRELLRQPCRPARDTHPFVGAPARARWRISQAALGGDRQCLGKEVVEHRIELGYAPRGLGYAGRRCCCHDQSYAPRPIRQGQAKR